MSTSKISRRKVIKTLAAISCGSLMGSTTLIRTEIRPLIKNPKNVIILRGDDGHLYVIPLSEMKAFRMPVQYEKKLKEQVNFRSLTTTIPKHIARRTGFSIATTNIIYVKGLK